MKRVILNKVPFTGEDAKEKSGTLDCRGLIMTVLLIPSNQEQGMNYEEMSRVMPLHLKFKGLKNSDNEILLEDEEHKTVVQRIRAAQFHKVTPELFEMMSTIIDAEDIEVEKKGGKKK